MPFFWYIIVVFNTWCSPIIIAVGSNPSRQRETIRYIQREKDINYSTLYNTQLSWPAIVSRMHQKKLIIWIFIQPWKNLQTKDAIAQRELQVLSRWSINACVGVCGGWKEKIVFINYLHLVVFLLVVISVVTNCQEKGEKINKRARRAECVCVWRQRVLLDLT